MSFERAYRFTCSFCNYRLDVVPSLTEWAKTVMQRHAELKHSKEMEELKNAEAKEEAKEEESR